jgi:hypothetical protein
MTRIVQRKSKPSSADPQRARLLQYRRENNAPVVMFRKSRNYDDPHAKIIHNLLVWLSRAGTMAEESRGGAGLNGGGAMAEAREPSGSTRGRVSGIQPSPSTEI